MNKAKLPTKTKIAVWWLLVLGVCLTIWSIIVSLFSLIFSADAGSVGHNWGVLSLLMFLGGILTIFSGISLSENSKRAWKVAAIALGIAMSFFATAYLIDLRDIQHDYPAIPWADNSTIPIILLFGLLCYLLPLIIIVIDRKNYFEMVRQRESEKKAVESRQSPGKDD